jgi:hypothetical protein
MAPRFLKNLCTSGRVHRKGIKISLQETDVWDVPKQDGSTRYWKASGTDKNQKEKRSETLHLSTCIKQKC